jgi:hypothetical protein
MRIVDLGIKSEIHNPNSEIKWPIPVFEILAIRNPLPISFPNAGGITVSNHTLAAILLIQKRLDLGR